MPRRRRCASSDRPGCQLPRPNSRARPPGPSGVNSPVERRSEAITSETWRPMMSPGITGTAIAVLVRTLPPTSSGRGSSCAIAAPAKVASKAVRIKSCAGSPFYPVSEGDNHSSRRSACHTVQPAGAADCSRRKCGAPGHPAGRHIWREIRIARHAHDDRRTDQPAVTGEL